jgi:DNA-binding MarR family transcriptional regulator
LTKRISAPKEVAEQALDRFWETVPALWSQIRGYIRSAAARKFRLSIEQFQILRLIRSGRGSVSELATAKNISRPAISQAVDALVKGGLLTRTQGVEDRRHVQLALTQRGNAVLDTIFDDTRSWMRTKMACLSRSELENVMRSMESLKKMID